MPVLDEVSVDNIQVEIAAEHGIEPVVDAEHGIEHEIDAEVFLEALHSLH
jgi:hypothetical protein